MSENTDIAAEADVEVQETAAEQVAGQDTTSEDAASEEAPAAAADEPGSETLDVPIAELRPALEAVLMIADQPLDHVTLASAVGYPPDQVAEALAGLAAEYAEQGRGFDLRNVAGGWRFYTREEYAAVVERFVLDGQQARLTQAALETLAVVAYKQPVSRARVAAIRGVNVDGVMRTLVARGLVEECGSDPETTALLYRTTSYFLERIGVTSIEELPELAPFLPEMGDLDDLEEAVPAAPSTPAGPVSPGPGPTPVVRADTETQDGADAQESTGAEQGVDVEEPAGEPRETGQEAP